MRKPAVTFCSRKALGSHGGRGREEVMIEDGVFEEVLLDEEGREREGKWRRE